MPAGGSSGGGWVPLPLVPTASAALSLLVLIQPMTPFSRPHTPNTQTLPQVLIRQPGHEITQEGTGSPRRRGHNKDFHGFLPLQKIVRFHALAVNVQDPLRGHFGFVVLEILVILAIDFVGVNIGQDLLKMFLTVPGAVFYFVPEP